VDEQEHSAGPGPTGSPGPTEPADPPGPVDPPGPPAPPGPEPGAGPGSPGRGQGVRKALTSRAAGWVVAAALAGAVAALAAVLATRPSAALLRPVGALRSTVVGPRLAGPARVALPPGVRVTVPANAPLRAVVIGPGALVSPGLLPVCRVPAGTLVLVPAARPPAHPGRPVRVQVRLPAAGPVPACPAGLRVQVPAGRARVSAG
jgi:hypothetical protein